MQRNPLKSLSALEEASFNDLGPCITDRGEANKMKIALLKIPKRAAMQAAESRSSVGRVGKGLI